MQHARVTDLSEAEFERLLTAHQARLLAWILSATGDAAEARDILQEVNLVLWRKLHQFVAGTNFTAWAYRVAHFQVLTWRQKRGRDLLVFPGETLDLMAGASDTAEETAAPRLHALQFCLQQLPERQREVIRRRHLAGESVQAIAPHTGLNANAVSQLLHRARQNLLDCMRRSTGGESAS
jgi:RNA polymerase sigma-70 factor (ECF subfamily)